MQPDTPPAAPGPATELPVPAVAPLRKRLLADSEILRRRAEGQTLKQIKQAERLKQETQLVRLERHAEKREREAAEKAARAAKRKAVRDAKAAEPEVVVWDKESGESYDSYVERAAKNGQHGRVLSRRAITWS